MCLPNRIWKKLNFRQNSNTQWIDIKQICVLIFHFISEKKYRYISIKLSKSITHLSKNKIYTVSNSKAPIAYVIILSKESEYLLNEFNKFATIRKYFNNLIIKKKKKKNTVTMENKTKCILNDNYYFIAINNKNKY